MLSDYTKTNAIILRSEPLRTSSLKMILHTLSSGRLILQARGYYKDKRYQTMSLSPGAEIEVVFLCPKSGGIPLIKEMDLISYPETKGAGELAVLHHFIEFMYHIRTEDHKEHSSIYKLFISLRTITKDAGRSKEKLFLNALAHEVLALKILGFLPDMSTCFLCDHSFAGRQKIFFLLEDTSFCCNACVQGKKSISFSENAGVFLQEILKNGITPHKLKNLIMNSKFSFAESEKIHSLVQYVFQSIIGHGMKSDFALTKK